jgi:hypothetical protein
MSIPATVLRFGVSEVAVNAPGNCFVCKTINGPFIVTGLKHDYWKEAPDASRDGDVYLCAACVREMASTLNLMSVDIQAQINEARRAGVLEGVLLGKKALDEFALGFTDSVLFTSINASGYRLVSVEDDEGNADGKSAEPPAVGEGSQPVDKSGSGEGADGVPGNSGGVFDGDF